VAPLAILAALAVVLSILVAPVVDLVGKLAVAPYYKAAGIAAAGGDVSTGIGIATIWPLFLVLAVVIVPVYLFVRVRSEDVRPAYMCGENAVGVSTMEFRSVGDKPEMVNNSNYYFDKALGEASLNGWANPAAIALLVALVGVVVWR